MIWINQKSRHSLFYCFFGGGGLIGFFIFLIYCIKRAIWEVCSLFFYCIYFLNSILYFSDFYFVSLYFFSWSAFIFYSRRLNCLYWSFRFSWSSFFSFYCCSYDIKALSFNSSWWRISSSLWIKEETKMCILTGSYGERTRQNFIC